MADAGDLQARLDAIRAAFIADLPRRAAELRGLWADLDRQDWSAGPLQEFRRRVHSLSGSGATFGCDALSRCAQAVEEQLQAPLQGNVPGDRARLSMLFTELLAVLDAAAAGSER